MENPEFPQPTKVVVRKSPVHGLGVFATADIETGELVERCPMIPLEFRSKYHKDAKLFEYLYLCSEQIAEYAQNGVTMCMVLGYGMIYNHQDKPNANWNFNWSQNYADLIAQRAIVKGDEIFTYYGQYYFNTRTKIQHHPDTKVFTRPIFGKKK